jgi:hypothetical protein
MTEPEDVTPGPPGIPSYGTPADRRRWMFVGPLVALLLLVAGGAAIVASGGGNGNVIDAASPLELASVKDEVAEHYRYAEVHQTEFTRIR